MKTLTAALFFFLLAPMQAGAADMPLVYARSTLLIKMKTPVDAAYPGVAFDTEIRDAEAASKVPGWFSIASMTDYKGAMLTYSAPTYVAINPSNEFAPADILMMDAYGNIVQLMPSIVLSELQETLLSAQPVVAVLYMKGGTCARHGIKPGDTVEYKLFKKRPVVLTAPENASQNSTIQSSTGGSPPTVLPTPNLPPADLSPKAGAPLNDELVDALLKKYRQAQ